jgi:hypothetical protein
MELGRVGFRNRVEIIRKIFMSELTFEQRNDLINMTNLLTRKMYGPSDKKLSTKELRTLKKERDNATIQYLEGLPVVPVGRCPYCNSIVKKTIDTFGLDGPWWDIFGKDPKPQSCDHFFVMLGALNLEGFSFKDSALETDNEIQPGPEVPYLIPRILKIPGMKCIIFSRRIIHEKHTAYFMTYFADPPAPQEQGHQSWLRTQFSYIDGQGHSFWNSCNDVWDFKIENWITGPSSKLGWIHPDDADMNIQFTQSSQCPYIKIPGRRWPLSIKQGEVYELPLPSGTPFGQDIFQ